MNRLILCLFSLLLTTSLFAQTELIVDERIILPSDRDYGKVEKQIYYYYSDKSIAKIEHYYTSTFAEETGIYLQIDNYNNKQISFYEMMYTEENIQTTFCKSIREYVNSKDEIIRIEVMLEDGNTASFSGTRLQVLRKFPLKPLLYHEKSYADDEYPTSEDSYLIEIPISSSMSYVSVIESQIPISLQEKKLLDGWSLSHGYPSYSHLYNFKIKVVERGREYYLLLQDNVNELIVNGENILIYYYFIGGLNTGPVFAAINFYQIP